jgi:benzylsuccinate CoA-transferase BbsE subunit
MTSTPNAAALAGITVLDVAGPLGNYCGKLFADLGARVILVEPPEGAPTRHIEPRISGRDDPDSSLTFQYQNTNKESIALDLDSEAGQEVFRRLAGQSALVIESEQPGAMARRGLGFADLRGLNPSLTLTSITAFGQSGPFSHWLATDLTAMGMGGMMYLAGYPDTAPMVACGEQAVGAANVFAGVASMSGSTWMYPCRNAWSWAWRTPSSSMTWKAPSASATPARSGWREPASSSAAMAIST